MRICWYWASFALGVILTHPLVRGLGSRILGPPASGDDFEHLHKVSWFKHAQFGLPVSPMLLFGCRRQGSPRCQSLWVL